MSETEPGGWNMELTDVQLDPDDPGRVLGAGVGGLHAWDASAEGDPPLLWKYPESFEIYDRLEVFGGGLVALAASGRPTTLLDAGGGAEPVPLEAFDVPGAGGMAWSGPMLEVLSLEGEAVPVDLADPASPRVHPGTPGLGTPWEGVVVGYRLLVADNALGIAVLSLADPLSPVLENPLDPGTPLLDLDADGPLLAAAGGSVGLLLFDSDQLGSPVVLVFFATWCPACRPELSDLEHLAADLASDGVPVWAVASREDEATVAAYAAELGLSAITVLLDEDGAVHDLYTQLDAFPSAAYPEEWVIGADGRVAYVNNAYEPDELLAVIEEELAEGR